MASVRALALALGIAVGCSGTPDGPTGPEQIRHGRSPAARCDALRPHVTALYRAALARRLPPDASDETRATEAQLLADDVEMVLTDCRRQPDRVAPCLEAAPSADGIERRCLIPLDDAGSEGLRLRHPDQ